MFRVGRVWKLVPRRKEGRLHFYSSSVHQYKSNNNNNNNNNNFKAIGIAFLSLTGITAGIGTTYYFLGSCENNGEDKKSKNITKFGTGDGTTSTVPRLVELDSNEQKGTGLIREGQAYTVGEKVSMEELKRRFDFHKTKKSDGSESNRIAVIGRGAYGRVISATERSTGRQVAVKIVPMGAMSAESLLREVQVLRRVRGHDNIVHLLDVLECGGEWYVITELCQGGELLERVIQHGVYTEEGARNIIKQLAGALQHIHHCGYVHLDIKPENVVFLHQKAKSKLNSNTGDVINPENLEEDCRVIDFGMALEIDGLNRKGGLVMGSPTGPSNFRVGTMAYWSPEQIKIYNESEAVRSAPIRQLPRVKTDPRACDVWALGVILYIILFGCHPFDPDGQGDEKELIKRALTLDPQFPSHPKTSQEAIDLISHMLDKNPDTRYSTQAVLDHPWMKSFLNKSRTRASRLPHSWTRAGYVSPSLALDEKLLEAEHVKPYKSERALRAFFRAVLISAISNASQQNDGSIASMSMSSSSISVNNYSDIKKQQGGAGKIFSEAFDVIDIQKTGRIRLQDIELFYRSIEESIASPPDHVQHQQQQQQQHQSLANYSFDKIDDQGISLEEFEALLRSSDCAVRRFEAGDTVFVQGALPQGMYVLSRGEARVEWDPTNAMAEDSSPIPSDSSTSTNPGSSSKPRVVQDYAKMNAGTIFGETALLQGRRARAATIRCVTPSEVIFIPKDDFLHAIAGSTMLHKKIFEVITEQQSRRVHELVEHFRPASYRLVQFAPGDCLFEQGDEAVDLFFIRKGVVEISVRASASPRSESISSISVRVGQRSAGDIVGLSTIAGGHRHTTAKALTSVECDVISKEDAQRLWKEVPIFRFYIQPQIQWRNEAWQQAVTDVERGLSEPQLLPMTGSANSKNKQEAHTTFVNAMSKMQRKSFKAGEFIINKGSTTKREFFVVESGFVNVELVSPKDGDSKKRKGLVVSQLGPGDHIGEQSILGYSPEDFVSVKAASDATLLVMSEEDFFSLLGDGTTPFADTIYRAARQREQRWLRNILNLAMRNSSLNDPTGPRGGWTRVANGIEERGGVFRLTLSKGQALFDAGEEIDSLYFVHRGELILNSDLDDNMNNDVFVHDNDDHSNNNNNNNNIANRNESQALKKRQSQKRQRVMNHKQNDNNDDEEVLKDEEDVNEKEIVGAGGTLGWEGFRDQRTLHKEGAIANSERTVVSKIPIKLVQHLIDQYDYVTPQLEKRVRSNIGKNSSVLIKHQTSGERANVFHFPTSSDVHSTPKQQEQS